MPGSSLNRLWQPAALLLLGLSAGACTPEYEWDRPGTWRPMGANEHNLQVMAADPRDLTFGASATTERGSGASRAVTRLLIDRRRQLLNSSTSRLSPSDSAPADQGLPTGGGGGGGGSTASSSAQ